MGKMTFRRKQQQFHTKQQFPWNLVLHALCYFPPLLCVVGHMCGFFVFSRLARSPHQEQVLTDAYISQVLVWCMVRPAFQQDIEVPSLVDGKRRNLALVSDFVSLDETCRVPRHKITHECKIPPLSIHE